MEQFYVQRLAKQAITRIVPLPSQWETKKAIPFSLAEEECLAALAGYQKRLTEVLMQVQIQPETFGMVCCPIVPDYTGPITKEGQKSLKSFARLRNALATLAKAGEITDDGGLFCSFDQLKSAKIPRVEAILEGLAVSGFILRRQNKDVLLYDSENKHIFTIMKAFSHADALDGLMTADIRYLQKNPGEPIAYTVEDIARQVPPHQQAFVQEVCDRFARCGYCIKVEYGYNLARIRIAKTNSGKDMITIFVERDGRLEMLLRLSKIADDAHEIENMSQNVQEQTVSGRDCCYCGCCKEGCVRFTLHGTQYEKCSLICCGFHYVDPTPEDVTSLLQLIHYEWEV